MDMNSCAALVRIPGDGAPKGGGGEKSTHLEAIGKMLHQGLEWERRKGENTEGAGLPTGS